MNDRVVKNPNFNNTREFHANLKARGVGAKGYPNTHTEVEHLGGGKFGASVGVGHRVFFDKADGNKPKKHKLTDERPDKDYILVQGANCCVEVYPYYAKYFDVHHEEVRLYEERWVVQRLFKEPDEWRDVDAYNPVISVEEYPEPAGDVVKVTITYDTDYGVLTVEYFQRDDNALKHNVYFRNTSGSTETFRVAQKWAGIVGNKVKTRQDEYEISARKVLADLDFTFGSGEQPSAIQENFLSIYKGTNFEYDLERAKWEIHGACDGCGACCKAYGCQHYNPDLPDKCEIHIDKAAQQWKSEEETLEEWLERRDERCRSYFQPVKPPEIEQWEQCGFSFTPRTIDENTKIPNCLLKPVAVDIHAQGMKADFIYGNWTLAQNESLEIDPDTVTLVPPTEFGHLTRTGGNGELSEARAACLVSAPSRTTSPFYPWCGGKAVDFDSAGSDAYRTYFEWDITSIPLGYTITDTVFKYDGYSDSATDEEINPITEEAPSGATDLNLYGYIASGVAYVDPWNFTVGTGSQIDLGASADADLQAAVDAEQSWFAIGIQSPDDECPDAVITRLIQFRDLTPRPTLYVVYSLPAVGIENKSANMGSKMVATGLI